MMVIIMCFKNALALRFIFEQHLSVLNCLQAILKKFPGSSIIDVRDPETLKPVEESDEESR